MKKLNKIEIQALASQIRIEINSPRVVINTKLKLDVKLAWGKTKEGKLYHNLKRINEDLVNNSEYIISRFYKSPKLLAISNIDDIERAIIIEQIQSEDINELINKIKLKFS